MTGAEDTDFEAFDFDELKAALDRDQPPDSPVSIWERLVAGLLSKSKEELREIVTNADDALMEDMVDNLIKTEVTMRVRHELVVAAMARLAAVAPADSDTEAARRV